MIEQLERQPGDQYSLVPAWSLTKEQRGYINLWLSVLIHPYGSAQTNIVVTARSLGHLLSNTITNKIFILQIQMHLTTCLVYISHIRHSFSVHSGGGGGVRQEKVHLVSFQKPLTTPQATQFMQSFSQIKLPPNLNFNVIYVIV